MLTYSIASVFVEAIIPPQNTPFVPSEHPVIFFLSADKCPKAAAFPVVAIVI